MKSLWLRFWCRWFHGAPMWPAHGVYRCARCLREYPTGWDKGRSVS